MWPDPCDRIVAIPGILLTMGRRSVRAHPFGPLWAALLLVSMVGCGNHPSQRAVNTDQAVPVPDVLNDGSEAVESCDRLRARFAERQHAVLRGAYRSTVADVTAWRLGGRFPEAVPQFLAARPTNAVVDVCFLDMDIAKAPPPAIGANGDIITAPSHNRAVFLVDASSAENAMMMSGFHDTPGWSDLPVVPVS
jgi:hypothetical protein